MAVRPPPAPAVAEPAVRRAAAPAVAPAGEVPRRDPPATARFVVAEADPEVAKALVELLGRWKIASQWVQDGGQALLQVHRKRPDGVVVGGHLPGLAAPALCEIVRRTAELAGTKLIRVASLDEPAGAPEFEADHVVQPAGLIEGLGPILAKLGLGKAPEAAGATAGAARATAPGAAGGDPRVAAAERLARIIVSDIILYNEAKFRTAAAQGNVSAALEHELTEASALFRQRVPEEIRAARNFLTEELESRAAKLLAG